MLGHEPPTPVAPGTGARRAAADAVRPRTTAPRGAAALAPPHRQDPLAGLLARAVAARSAVATPPPPGGPTLQRLVSTKTFKERTAVTMAVRGKTLEELDRLLAEYHELLKTSAHLKPGPGMNRLQQVLTEIRDDARFWIDSHSDDTTARGKKRRAVIQALHDDAQAELITLRAGRSKGLAGDVHATPEQAMKLISWGWYRQFREARAIPREVANFMWGGSTTSVGFKRAEQWAANVEKEAFKRDYARDTALSSGVGSKATTNEYVRFGALAGIGADVGGVAGSLFDVGAAVGVNAGTHYDQTSLEQAKGGQANVGVPMTERGRFNLKHLGSGFVTFDTAVYAAIGPFSGEIGVALELMMRKHRENDANLAYPEGYVSIGGSLGLVVPAPKLLLSAIATGVKQLITPLQNATDRIEVKAKQDVKGLALDGLEAQMADALTRFPTRQLELALDGSDAWSEVMTGALPMPGSLTLSIAGGYQFGPSLDNFTFDISLSHGVALGVNASLVGMSLSRSSRLFRIVIAPGTTRTGRANTWMVVVD